MTQHAEPRSVAPKRRTYLGTCECGAIRYSIALDLAMHDPRTRSVWERSAPATNFHLLLGHESLVGYQFAREDAHHFFCTRCNMRAFSLCAPEGAAYYSVDLKALRGLPANSA